MAYFCSKQLTKIKCLPDIFEDILAHFISLDQVSPFKKRGRKVGALDVDLVKVAEVVDPLFEYFLYARSLLLHLFLLLLFLN
jgi:hypothetical protein